MQILSFGFRMQILSSGLLMQILSLSLRIQILSYGLRIQILSFGFRMLILSLSLRIQILSFGLRIQIPLPGTLRHDMVVNVTAQQHIRRQQYQPVLGLIFGLSGVKVKHPPKRSFCLDFFFFFVNI